MDNTGKKSGMYGTEPDESGWSSVRCQLCGARVPRYPIDYPYEKLCINCGATLVPWEERDER